jgi:hypothetical protein
MGKIVADNITSDNSGTDWISTGKRNFNISISGTFAATVTLQRRFGQSDTAKDVNDFTSPIEKIAENVESNVQYRLFVKSGNYTSGAITARLSF